MRPSLKKRSPLFGGSGRRTSPRKDQGTRSTCWRLFRQYSIFIVLWLVLVPFIWSTLQWSIDDSIYHFNHPTVKSSERTRVAEPTSAPTTQSKEISDTIERPQPQLAPDNKRNEPLIPISLYQPSSTNPLQVVFVGAYRMKVKADGETDGQFQVLGNMLESLQLSKYIRVVTCLLYNHASIDVQVQEFATVTSSVPAVYIVDWWALQRDCHILDRVLQQTPYQAGDKLVLVDTSASPSIRSCEQESQLVKSSLVRNRRWNFANQWVITGERVARTTPQMTGYVAEVFVDRLREFEGSKRTSDVVHYWSSATIDNDIPNLQYSALRRTVSAQIKATHRHLSKEYELGPWVDEIGIKSSNRSDEFDVLEETARELSSAKIVVVAQSDEWEFVDNRLMEALASGALVLADEMLAPPPGLYNKTHLVFYNSTQSLDTLIEYYLQNESKRKDIGRRGQQYSLGRHRSWHVFEQLLFGKAMTRTNKGLAENPAKPITFDNSTSDIIQLV